MSALATLIDRSRTAREDWRYTDVEKLLKELKSPAVQKGAKKDLPSRITDPAQRRRIVFVDGAWNRDLTQFNDLPSSLLQGSAEDGYQLSFAAQTCLVTAPIELVFVGEGADETDTKLSIDIGANSSLTIVEHYVGEGAGTHIIETDIRLGDQAKLVHGKVMHDLAGMAHFSRASVRVEGGAYYRHALLAKNTQVLRHEIEVNLAGHLAQCGLYGAMLLRGREHVDVRTQVNHIKPHGSSQQLYKAIVKDRARGVFQGRVNVAEGAQKTDAQQLCRALLLSDQAEMDAKPELEIYADDVKCSHGCAIGDLDADTLFYLRSRGLGEEQARALLLQAFIDEAIDTIPEENARVYVRGLAERWLHEQE